MDDVIINKIAVIERCLKRIDEVYKNSEQLECDFTSQDSIILNLQRACEASIDLAMRIIRKKKLGIPQSAREVFGLLEEGKIISSELCKNLQAMVGFRNIAIHEYQKINLEIVKSILATRLIDFRYFIDSARVLIS